jgi:serine/threonine-protein kinase
MTTEGVRRHLGVDVRAIAPDETIGLETVRRSVAEDETLSAAGDASGPLTIETLPRLTMGAAVAPEAASTVPRDLVPLSVLGEGGMGLVLLARQTSLGRDVAVKTVKPDATEAEKAALVREARVTGTLEHPSIVPVHALGVDEGGRPLLVMKRVEGVSWRRLIDDPEHPEWGALLGGRGDRLDVHLDVLIAVCRAVERAHARGLIHRDLKPENVMLGPFGEVYVVDWGIATTAEEAARERHVVGTPAYMAPELACRAPVDARTDVYLLGACLHRALTGRPRHAGNASDAILAAVSSEPAHYGDDVPELLGDLCNRACSADPRDRPQSVRELREEVLSFRRHRSAVAMCDVARARIERLERMLADAGATVPSDLAACYRLATEARFGFGQSLQQFPRLEAAREGVSRTIAALVDLELRQHHVDTARALLEDLPQPSAELVAKVAAAEKEKAAREEEEAQIRALARELDPNVERGARIVVGGVLLLVTIGVAMAARQMGPASGGDVGPKGMVVLMGVVLGATVVGMFALRRRLLRSALNRRLAALVVIAEVAMLLNRFLGLHRGTSSATIFGEDALLLATSLAVGAGVLLPRLWACVPILLGAIVMLDRMPDRGPTIFSIATVAISALIAWAVATHRGATKSP